MSAGAATSLRVPRKPTHPYSRDRARGTPPKVISLTDPCARWTAAPGGPAFFAYSTNYLVDVQVGIIVDVEATPAHRTQEVEATKTMLERVEERFDITPTRLIGDTAYGTVPTALHSLQKVPNALG